MVKHKLFEYYLYRKIIKVLFLSCGIYPIKNPNLLYRTLPYIHLLLMTIKLVGSVGFVRVHFTNVIMVSKRFGVMVSQMTAVLELLYMTIYSEDLRKLHEILDAYFENLANIPEFTDIISNDSNVFWRLSWTVSMTVLFAGTTNIIAPVLSIKKQNKLHIQPLKYILPNGSVYPWNVIPGGFLWKIHYFCESFSVLTIIAVTSSVIPLFCIYVFQMIGRLRAMSYNMLNLNKTIASEISVRNCIRQYETLLKCRDKLEKIFGLMIFWMIITNSIILCLAIFQLSQITSITVTQGTFFIMYLFLKLAQTFLFAYTGSQLVSESENYRDAIYAADWHGNKRLMSSVVIMLTQKPLKLMATKFSTISVNIFISVINTAMSYFFLLKTLQH